MRVVILGIGNILLGDEGVGVRAVEAIERDFILPEGVVAIDGGCSATSTETAHLRPSLIWST